MPRFLTSARIVSKQSVSGIRRNPAFAGPHTAVERLVSYTKAGRESHQRTRRRSMSLDRDNQEVLDMMKAAGRPPVHELQPEEARQMYRASRGALQPELPEV